MSKQGFTHVPLRGGNRPAGRLGGYTRPSVLVLLLFAHVLTANAQNSMSAGFEREVNRYRWSAGTELDVVQGKWAIRIRDRFRSDAFLLFDDRLSFRDENRLGVEARRPISGISSFTIRSQSDWFSLSRVYHQDVLAGMRIAPSESWWVEPFAGVVVDARPGFGAGAANVPVRTDAGPSFGVRLSAPPGTVNGYQVQADVEAEVQRMSPRSANQFRLDSRASRTFENTTVQTTVRAASVKRDAYQSASFLNREDAQGRQAETVEATRNDTLEVALGVETALSEPVSIIARINASANSRLVRTLRAPEDALFFDSDFNRRIVDATLAGVYERGATRLRLSATVGAETERRSLANEAELPSAQVSQKLNLLRQADYDRGFLSLQTGLLFPLFSRTALQLDMGVNLLQHDTPDINPDDRDELLYNGSVGVQVQASEELQFMVQVVGSWFHTVYLKAERSAENNVQRSLRFVPTVMWQPGRRTRVRFSSEVRATYTVDDFVLAGRRPTDQSAREMRFDAEIDHDLGAGMRILASGSTSDLRLGRFLDRTFAEIPFDTLRTYSGWVRVQAGRRIQAEIGLRVFIRTDFERSATVRYTGEGGNESSITRAARTRIDQMGPTTALVWPMPRGGFLRIDGWATMQRVSHRLYGTLPPDDMDVIRRAARRGRTTIIPNLAVSMQWTL